jgi:hypothetical protein
VSDEVATVENTKPCAYCGSSISVRASLCPVCKSYQSSWRNVVIYIAGIAGLIGLLGSAAVYIISEVPNISKVLMWHDQIKLWEFSARYHPNFSLNLSNVGDGPIIVSTILIYWDRGNAQYPVGKLVLPTGSLIIPAKIDPRHDYYVDVADKSGTPNSTVISHSSIAFEDPNLPSPCFMMIFYNEDNVAISRMQNAYGLQKLKLVEEPVQGLVVYYSIHDKKEVKTTFPVVATFEQSTKPECAALNYQN